MDSRIYEYLTVAQYDAETIFNISITKYGEPYNIDDMGAIFTMKKQDGHIIVNACDVTNNVITVNSTYQMTFYAGKIPFQIVLYSGTDILSSITGTLLVVESPSENDGGESVDEYSIIQQISYYSSLAKSYAVGDTELRPDEDTDNAKYYYEISRDSVTGLTPQGSVTFAELIALSPSTNDMYNVTDAFVSTSDFEDGGDHPYPAGTDVYYNSNGKWDALCGHTVIGVKGSAESEYRAGNVNITKDNIELPNGRNIVNSTSMPSTPPDIWLQPFSVE